MPQDPLPKLNRHQQILWDSILARVTELEEVSRVPAEGFKIEIEVNVKFFTVSVITQNDRTKYVLRDLAKRLERALQDPVLSQYSFVQRTSKQIERMKNI